MRYLGLMFVLAVLVMAASTSADAESRWIALDEGGPHPTILVEMGSRWLERDPCKGQANGVNTPELARIVRDIQLDLCPDQLEFKLRGETMEEFRALRDDYRRREREKAELERKRRLAEAEAEKQRLAEQREKEKQERLRAYREKYGLDQQPAPLPAPRSGGFYDQPLVLRPGIDDLFMSFGQFVSCLEHTLEYFAAQGSRPQHLSEVEVTSVRNEVTLFFYGVSDEHIYLQFTAYSGYVLMRSIETPDHIIYGWDIMLPIVHHFISAC